MSFWTDAKTDELRTALADGLTFSEAALRVGCSRAAAIGKADRLGVRSLHSPFSVGSIQPKVPKIRAARKSRAKQPKEAARPEPVVAPDPSFVNRPSSGDGVAIMELRLLRMCRWPCGDPQDNAFRFCGASIDPAATYCALHRALAYVPGKPKLARSGEQTKLRGGKPFSFEPRWKSARILENFA